MKKLNEFRPYDRIDVIMNLITIIWKVNPHLRLWQLLENAGINNYTEDVNGLIFNLCEAYWFEPRFYVMWWTIANKNGDYVWRKLEDLSSSHLKNIVSWNYWSNKIRECASKLLEDRWEAFISLEDWFELQEVDEEEIPQDESNESNDIEIKVISISDDDRDNNIIEEIKFDASTQLKNLAKELSELNEEKRLFDIVKEILMEIWEEVKPKKVTDEEKLEKYYNYRKNNNNNNNVKVFTSLEDFIKDLKK